MLELLTATSLDLGRSAARHGAGLFETIRVESGRPLRLALHLERLARSLAFLGMDEGPEEATLRGFLADETPLAALELGVLRLVAVDDRMMVWAEPLDAGPRPPLRIGIASGFHRSSNSPLNRHKTLSYLENRLLTRQALAQGLFELLALNEYGRLTDGSRTSLLLVHGKEILTPPVEEGALPGTLRGLLLRAGLVREAPLAPEDLRTADGILLCNALREVLPVAEVVDIGAFDSDPPALRAVRAAVEDSKA